jgi:hypothetical protein
MTLSEFDRREFTTLCLCSFRYAIDRETGISFEICNIIERHINIILPWAKEQMARDINRKLGAEGFKHAHDEENWRELKEKLDAML